MIYLWRGFREDVNGVVNMSIYEIYRNWVFCKGFRYCIDNLSLDRVLLLLILCC
jgi:hypothetical protein